MPKRRRESDNGDEVNFKRRLDWGKIVTAVLSTVIGFIIIAFMTGQFHITTDGNASTSGLNQFVNENKVLSEKNESEITINKTDIRDNQRNFISHAKEFENYKVYNKELIKTQLKNLDGKLDNILSRLPK